MAGQNIEELKAKTHYQSHRLFVRGSAISKVSVHDRKESALQESWDGRNLYIPILLSSASLRTLIGSAMASHSGCPTLDRTFEAQPRHST
jgi:hypothetical protein